ncbi:MAG: trigger factor [Candidatus Omnitrophica bacterium]|nr:trigger factor [Candidatus Omnitrophota bacterium]
MTETLSATLQETAPCQKRLTVEVPREAVDAEFQAVYRDLKRKAHVPGFRVGSAPQDLLQRYHGAKAREEVLRRLLDRTLDEAVRRQGEMDLVGRPQITEVKLEANQPLIYTAQLEVAPQVTMGRYKGLKLTRPKADVSEENVGKILAHLAESHAELKPVLIDRPAAEGDFLLADLDKKQKDALIHLSVEGEEGDALKPLLGVKPGESRTVTLKNGKSVLVEVKAIKVKEVALLDDAFARSVGSYETLEALKEAIRLDLKRQADAAQRQALESQALAQLTEEWEFDVPPSLVVSQARRLLKERAVELMNQGVPMAQVQERAALLTDQAKVDALKQVKLFFVLRRIALTEHFTASEEEVNQRIQALAERLGTPVEQVRQDLEKRDMLEEIAWGIIRTKVLDLLLKEAEIKEG